MSGRSVVGWSDTNACGSVNERAKNAEQTRREQRLRAALRENLKRRKAQAKGRASAAAPARPPHDSAGIAEDKQES
jgi:hypothetical protein